MEVFEQMRGVVRESNVYAAPGVANAAATEAENRPMTPEELSVELTNRELLMQKLQGQANVMTDQWRVYQEIVEALQQKRQPLRMFLQASAGTGKSFLLEAIYLWCLVHGYRAEACAPTGIAAARLRVPRTGVRAYTLHNLFMLNVELESRIDPSKMELPQTTRLRRMTVLFMDEVSMVDDAAWFAMKDQLTSVGALPKVAGEEEVHPAGDDFGSVHMILSGDFKQLPPATSRPPFIAADPAVLKQFRFRVLRENRRVTSSEDPDRQRELDRFHETLEDISQGRASRLVREFVVDSYVRGAGVTQDKVAFDGNTACFTKRRYRDGWNKRVLERSARCHQRSLKVKAVFIARGTQSQCIGVHAAATIKRTVRSQALVNLRLAGQWKDDPPRVGQTKPHWMRAMLVANEDVENGFANGTTGRVVYWGPEPELEEDSRKPVLANVPGVMVRFYKEESVQSQKTHYLPNVDFMDIVPRRSVHQKAGCIEGGDVGHHSS